MTAREAATALSLSYSSILLLIHAGKLGCRRLGPRSGKIDITDQHVAAYLESCEKKPVTREWNLKHITIKK